MCKVQLYTDRLGLQSLNAGLEAQCCSDRNGGKGMAFRIEIPVQWVTAKKEHNLKTIPVNHVIVKKPMDIPSWEVNNG